MGVAVWAGMRGSNSLACSLRMAGRIGLVQWTGVHQAAAIPSGSGPRARKAKSLDSGAAAAQARPY